MGLGYKCILPTLGRMWAGLPQMERMQVAISPKYRRYLVQYNTRWWTSTNIPCRQRAYEQAQNPSIRTFAQIWDNCSVHYISCHPMCSTTCQAGSWPRILESLTCSFGRSEEGSGKRTYAHRCIRCCALLVEVTNLQDGAAEITWHSNLGVHKHQVCIR